MQDENKGCFGIVFEVCVGIGVCIWLWNKEPRAVLFILAIIVFSAALTIWVAKSQEKWNTKKRQERAKYDAIDAMKAKQKTAKSKQTSGPDRDEWDELLDVVTITEDEDW